MADVGRSPGRHPPTSRARDTGCTLYAWPRRDARSARGDGGSTLSETCMDTGLLDYSLTGIIAHLVYFGIASVAVVSSWPST